jgi:hypothetical protein
LNVVNTGDPLWSSIRALRARRPGRAESDAGRAAVFGAALEQCQQLMEAAASVGYAARPLPLFYAVSQAGRAIAAAFAEEPWELSGHGLKHKLREPIFRSIVRPTPERADTYSHVARSLSHQALSAPVELGALWASLPDLRGVEFSEERWHRPLRVLQTLEEAEDASARILGAKVLDVAICGLPNRVFEDLRPEQEEAVLAAELAYYPSAAGWTLRAPGLQLNRPDEDGWDVDVRWGVDNSHGREWELELRAPEYRVREERWLWPVVNEAQDRPSPLMTWWALLYGLSMLARYHPAPWTEALGPDDSRDAVPLEAALDEALDAVPYLLLEALRQEPVVLPAI